MTTSTLYQANCSFRVKEYDNIPYLFIDLDDGFGHSNEVEEIRLLPLKGISFENLQKLADTLSETFETAESRY